MPIRTVTISLTDSIKKKSTSTKPTVMKWKGEEFIRIHSLRASVGEILNKSEDLDHVRIGIIGDSGTGKTTLAKSLAHLIHKISDERDKIPFAVKVFTRDDLIKFHETIKTLEHTNQVLIFDDLSFLTAQASKRQIDTIKQGITEIRHLEGSSDVRIISIYNYHYTKGLDPYLRQSHFKYFTDIGSSELANIEQIVGHHNMRRIHEFKKKISIARNKRVIPFKLGEKWFHYKQKKPFCLSLFYNENTLRYVIFPKREWLDPVCSVCTNTGDIEVKSVVNVEEFASQLSYKFGKQVSKSAVRTVMYQNGENLYSKRTKQCIEYLKRSFNEKIFDLKKLADLYNLKDERTKLDEKIEIPEKKQL